jgi:hypothetical protein
MLYYKLEFWVYLNGKQLDKLKIGDKKPLDDLKYLFSKTNANHKRSKWI